MTVELVKRYGTAGLTALGIASAVVLGTAGPAQAVPGAPGAGWMASPPSPNPNLTGLIAYIVNNSSRALALSPVVPAGNLAGHSDTVAPGDTGYAKSTGPHDALHVTYVAGNPQMPSGSADISIYQQDGIVETTCDAGGDVVCSVSPPQQPDWPRAVTIQDRGN